MIRNKRNTIRYFKVDDYDIIAYKQLKRFDGANEKGDIESMVLPAIIYVIHGSAIQTTSADLFSIEAERDSSWTTVGSPEHMDYMRRTIVDMETLSQGT